jgi:hypothetical protein
LASSSVQYSVLASGTAPTITSVNKNVWPFGAANNFTLTSSGSGSFTYSITSGGLPSGLSLSPSGVISGSTTASPGVYTVTISSNNGIAPAGTQTFYVGVGGFAEVELVKAPGQSYGLQTTTLTGTAPVTYFMEPGSASFLTISPSGVGAGNVPVARGYYTGSVTGLASSANCAASGPLGSTHTLGILVI